MKFNEVCEKIGSPMAIIDKAPIRFWNDVEITSFDSSVVMYRACSSERCLKKLEETIEGKCFCAKCKCTYATFQWKYGLKICVKDVTQTLWATAFDEVGVSLFAVTAEALACRIESGDVDLDNFLRRRVSTICRMLFSCRARPNQAAPPMLVVDKILL